MNNPMTPSSAGNSTGFVPTEQELRQLAKYWHRQEMGVPFYTWSTGRFTRDEASLYQKLWNLAMDRLEAVGRVLGPEVAHAVRSEVEKQFATTYGTACEIFNDRSDSL